LKKARSRELIAVCERYADGEATNDELRTASQQAWNVFGEIQWAAESDLDTNPARAVLGLEIDLGLSRVTSESAATVAAAAREKAYRRRQRARRDGQVEPWEQYDSVYQAAESEEVQAQTDVLREIIGNPFRPVTLDPAWRTSTVVALAQQMYESRDFSAMPILADAVQDAGCDTADILTHCRDPQQVHVRGCWVVDLVLGKE
jgi:hypothetical protein